MRSHIVYAVYFVCRIVSGYPFMLSIKQTGRLRNRKLQALTIFDEAANRLGLVIKRSEFYVEYVLYIFTVWGCNEAVKGRSSVCGNTSKCS